MPVGWPGVGMPVKMDNGSHHQSRNEHLPRTAVLELTGPRVTPSAPEGAGITVRAVS